MYFSKRWHIFTFAGVIMGAVSLPSSGLANISFDEWQLILRKTYQLFLMYLVLFICNKALIHKFAKDQLVTLKKKILKDLIEAHLNKYVVPVQSQNVLEALEQNDKTTLVMEEAWWLLWTEGYWRV